jgi:hypothetical protein
MEEETMKVFVGAVLGAIALWDCLMYYCLMKADAAESRGMEEHTLSGRSDGQTKEVQSVGTEKQL